MIHLYDVKKFCVEDISKIENYDKAVSDMTQTWDCHHRLGIQNGKTFSRKELKEMNLYYNRPACELMFLTRKEHTSLHQTDEHRKKLSEENTGKKLSAEHKKKISNGIRNSEKYKLAIKSIERSKNLSEVMKGKNIGKSHKQSEESKRKISEAMKGRKFTEEHKRKLSEAKKQKHNHRSKICTGK